MWYTGDPRGPGLWGVRYAGLDSLRADKASWVPAFAAILKERPEWSSYNEVSHVYAKDGHAIALTKHVTVSVDAKTKETIVDEHESVWMLRRIGSEWKIGSSISQVSGGQTVYRAMPE